MCPTEKNIERNNNPEVDCDGIVTADLFPMRPNALVSAKCADVGDSLVNLGHFGCFSKDLACKIIWKSNENAT